MAEKLKKILPVLAMIVGFVLMLYPWISEYLYENRVDSLVESYEVESKDLNESRKQDYIDEARKYNQHLLESGIAILDPFTKEKNDQFVEYQSILSLNEIGLMGTIEIPKIDVNLPIYHGTSDEVLKQGIGHLEGSSLPIGGENTHAILSGHTGLTTAKLFTDLTEMEEGDLFFIHVLDDTLAYKVYAIEVIEPSDISQLGIEKGKDLVTLLTCTPYGVNSHRLLVKGERTEYTPEEYNREIQSPSNTDSEWMNQYKKAVIIGISIVVLLYLLLKAHDAKRKNKEKDNSSDDYIVPPGAFGI